MNDDEAAEDAGADADLEALGRLAATRDGKRFLVWFFYTANVMNGVHRGNAEVYRLSGIQAFALGFWNKLWRANPEAFAKISTTIMRMQNPEQEDSDE